MGEYPLDKSFLAFDFFGKMAARILWSCSKNWTISPFGWGIAAALVVGL
jgi:hypothetical protein